VATIIERTLQDGSRRYLVQVRKRGAKLQTQTFARRTDAVRWGKSIESAIDEGRAFPQSSARKNTLAEVITRFLEGEGKRWPKDRRKYLEGWSDRLGHLTLAQLTRSEIIAARDKLVRDGTGPATVNRLLAYLSRVLSVAVQDYELLPANPMLRAKLKLAEPQHRVRFLSPVELAALREAAAKSETKDLAVFIEMALCSGARAGELVDLRWVDLDLEEGTATLHVTKSGKRRAIPLRGRALEMLRAKERTCEYVLTSNGKPRKDKPTIYGKLQYGKPFREAVKAAGIENFRAHDLRHTAASYLVQADVPLFTVQHLLGHASPTMTQKYAHLVSSQVATAGDKLAEALK
jgi:integrase